MKVQQRRRRRHLSPAYSRSLDTSTPLSLLRRGFSGTSTSTTFTTTPGRRHLASIRQSSKFLSLALSPRFLPFAFTLETKSCSLDRSLSFVVLQVDTCSYTSAPCRRTGELVNSSYRRIFYPMLLAYFSQFVECIKRIERIFAKRRERY